MFRILIAEDDRELRQLFQHVLMKNGYAVTGVADGKEALDAIDKGYYDLIISDIMMPVMDGYELVSSLRQAGINTPVMMITAKDAFDDMRLGFLSGTDEKGLNAFRVDTRGEGDDVWVTRYYNAPVSGSGTLDVDIWRQGNYEVRAAACDTDGNESPLADVGTVFIDTTSPVIRSLTITDITETGFSLHHRVTDNGTLAGLTVTLTSDTGEERSTFLVTDGESDFPWSADGLTEGVWTISVTATDAAGNGSRYTFDWKYTAGEARPGLTVARLGAP